MTCQPNEHGEARVNGCRKQERFWLVRSVALVCILVFGGSLAVAETVFIQSRTAKLRAGKTSLDPVVTFLEFGQDLTVLKRDGDWLEVRTESGLTGWIFHNKVTATKPSGGGSGFLERVGKSMRQGEASAVTASAGARGLDKASETYADRVGITKEHRDEVDRMAAYRTTDQEIDQFLQEGRLGEYGK